MLLRLYEKAEHLERLMGEEVTDINEILAVINNIQVTWSKMPQNYLDCCRPARHY